MREQLMTDSSAAPNLMTGGKNNIQIIYVLYLLGLLTGWLTAIVGLVMAYVARADVSDWLASHYEFVIRTFWIGLLGAAVSVLLFMTIILIPLSLLLGCALTVWWVVRCVVGLNHIAKGQPIPNPSSWLIA
jgi:uncharacterized membrane protein